MPDNKKEQLVELISNSKVAFLNGRYQEAFSLAKEAIRRNGSKAPTGYTWHHIEDGEHMLLVRTDVHSNFPHTGGASIVRDSL